MHAATLLSAAIALLPTTHAAPAFFPITNWFNHASQPPPTMPPSSLPAATGTLKYIALGLGTQNYTCATTTSTPVAGGAIANLYDATALLSAPGAIGSTSMAQMPCYADKMNSGFGLRQIGQHFFNGNGQPNFDLSLAGKGEYLQAVKAAVSPAPSDACAGRSGDPAVPWLFLNADATGRSSGGMGSVYRLVTAGGSASSCADAVNGWITRDYAAEYWFYG